MEPWDVTWLIGGPQGSGINASAEAFARACVRAGHRIHANIEYHSNIMGEHSYYRVRVSDRDRTALSEKAHVVVALDDESLFGDSHTPYTSWKGHVPQIVPGGAVVYDASLKVEPSRGDIRWCPVPYHQLLAQVLREANRESDALRFRVMENTIAVAASLALLEMSPEWLMAVMRDEFRRRPDAAELNVRAVAVGFEYAKERFADHFPFRLPAPTPPERRPMMLRGIQAAAIAKLKAGLHVQTYYPISPATDENVYLESQQGHYDLVVVQTEDEISAINMAVGAAHAGARASTSTSGPGFALMVEGIGFAAMTEAPGPVVFIWQRGGPSTGLPTRQEQGDLLFALHPAQGDFPHIVVAPGDTSEIVEDSYESFNWADRYQMPVIVLVDKAMGSTYVTADDLHLDRLPPIDRGVYAQANGRRDGYERYALTETGISPRSVPGQEGLIFWSTTDEHDPKGHISEDALNRLQMVDKRMGKLALAAKEIPASRKLRLYGPDEADLTLVGWGSTKGAVLAVLETLAAEGVTANFLQVRLMRPFPAAEVAAVLKRAKRTVLVENNATGQLGQLIGAHSGIGMDHRLLKYDGRPFLEEELIDALHEVLRAGAPVQSVSHLLG